MSSSSSTIPAKQSTGNSENKIIRYALISIWGILILFGFISILQPEWLVDISAAGKMTEAVHIRNAGDLLLKSGNYKAAVNLYKRAINIQPDLISAIGNLGICYTKLQRYDDAIRIFKHLLKTDKENTHTNYYNLAELYKRNGDAESAIEWYVKSAETNPYPIYSYQYLGELYLKLQRWDLAVRSFELALANKLTLENSYYGMLK
ncbi:MAG: tetratricopeptide repeat protein, partial [FCB group bacterium]|nr:tetratricopeptide repeat protein [FCB group bacterium]